MAKVKFNRDIHGHNVPPGTLGKLEDGVGIELDKHISIRDDLDAINEAEKRIFRKK